MMNRYVLARLLPHILLQPKTAGRMDLPARSPHFAITATKVNGTAQCLFRIERQERVNMAVATRKPHLDLLKQMPNRGLSAAKQQPPASSSGVFPSGLTNASASLPDPH
jgi:hypothetical protein